MTTATRRKTCNYCMIKPVGEMNLSILGRCLYKGLSTLERTVLHETQYSISHIETPLSSLH